MKLHEALRVVLNQMGYQTLSSGVLINALGDFRAFLVATSRLKPYGKILIQKYYVSLMKTTTK